MTTSDLYTGPTEPYRPASAAAVDRLAREVALLRRQVRHGSSKPRLGHSAIDDGALVTTSGGQTAAVFGTQYDGTNGVAVLTGPTPPVPTPPSMVTTPGGVVLAWDGNFQDPQPGFTSPVVAPMDFAGATFEVDTDPDFTGDVWRYGISSAQGGRVTVAWPTSGTPLYARLRTRSTAGKLSLPSLTVGPVSTGKVGLTDLGFNIEEYGGGTTVHFGTATPAVPTGGHTEGDLWLKEIGTSPGGAGQPAAGTPLYETYRWVAGAWKKIEAQGVSSALAQAITAQLAADAKAKVYYSDTAPTVPAGTAANSAVWFETDAGNKPWAWSGSAWVARTFGNGSITPNSLVASNVIATGTVTASLLEALLVLATTIVAGNPNGDHARLTSTGLRVYKADPVAQGGDGTPDEIVRLGTDSNDYFAVVNSNGDVVASVDDTGRASFQGLEVQSDPVFQGTRLSEMIGRIGGSGGGSGTGAEHYYSYANGAEVLRVNGEIGLHEMAVRVQAGRIYFLAIEIEYACFNADPKFPTEMRVRVRDSNGTSTPSNSSQQVMYRQTHAAGDGYSTTFFTMGLYAPATGGVHRLLLTVERAGPASNFLDITRYGTLPVMNLIDLGPAKAILGSVNRGGGTAGGAPAPPPPAPNPTQQYFWEGQAAGWFTYRGDGSRRTDVPGPVQGWDPSGFNGDGKGHWYFNLPSITGTVDRVDFYAYSNHWYYNNGGPALLLPTAAGNGGPNYNNLGKGQWNSGNWPKPGGRWVTVPADWFPLFRTNISPRADGIQVGPGGGSNLTNYGRFNGDARLRIWYTQ